MRACTTTGADANRKGPMYHWSPIRHQGAPITGEMMPRLAANLSLMFTELAFLDRFSAASRAGFKGVEVLFPYA